MSELHKAMHIAASGMLAQNVRVRVISQNIANSDSLATKPGELPYRRQTVSFRNELNRALGTNTVKVHEIGVDKSAFGSRLDPGHPASDENGYVQLPNVKRMIDWSICVLHSAAIRPIFVLLILHAPWCPALWNYSNSP